MLTVSPNVEINIITPLAKVTGVRSHFSQLFLNLISNVIKYNDKEHCVINLGCAKTLATYEFYVQDNGPGIDDLFKAKVFEMFQTLHSKDEIESTGIDLTLVKKLLNYFMEKFGFPLNFVKVALFILLGLSKLRSHKNFH